MSTPSIFRAEHRRHLIEVTLSQESDGRWQADWAVFQPEPFVAVAAGVLAAPAPDRQAAQATASRTAVAWIDTAPMLSAR